MGEKGVTSSATAHLGAVCVLVFLLLLQSFLLFDQAWLYYRNLTYTYAFIDIFQTLYIVGKVSFSSFAMEGVSISVAFMSCSALKVYMTNPKQSWTRVIGYIDQDLGATVLNKYTAGLLIVPVFFCLLSFVVSADLYGLDFQILTTEALLNDDSMLRVLVDLTDCVIALLTALSQSTNGAICTILMMIAMILHAFSVPGASDSLYSVRRNITIGNEGMPGSAGGQTFTQGESTTNSEEEAVADSVSRLLTSGESLTRKKVMSGLEFDRILDVSLSAKHSAMVSILAVNIPLLVVRCGWIPSGSNSGSSMLAPVDLFLIKNVVCLFPAIISLHRIRLFDELSAGYGRGNVSVHEKNPIITSNAVAVASHDLMKRHEQRADVVPGIRSRRSTVEQELGLVSHGSVSTPSVLRRTETHGASVSGTSDAKWPTVTSGEYHEFTSAETLHFENLDIEISAQEALREQGLICRRVIQETINDIVAVRNLPTNGFSSRSVAKCVMTTFTKGYSVGDATAAVLDDRLICAKYQLVLLALNTVVSLLARPILVCFMCVKFEALWFEPGEKCDLTCYYFLGTVCLLTIFNFVVSAVVHPCLSALLHGLAYGIELLSFVLVVMKVIQSGMLSVKVQTFENPPAYFNLEVILTFAFALPRLIALTRNTVAITGGMLGRATLVYRKITTTKGLTKAFAKLLSSSGGPGRDILASEKGFTDTKDPDKVAVATGGALIFTGSRYRLLPDALDEVLVSEDLLKALRLCDQLHTLAVIDLLFAILLRAIVALLSSVNLWVYAIFTVDLLCRTVRIVVGLTIRALAVRRFEVKLLFERMVLRWAPVDDAKRGSELFNREEKERMEARLHYLELVLGNLEQEGFFSSRTSFIPFGLF